MAKKANGAFLWVKLIMKESNAIVDLDQIEEVLAGFPEDMKEVYDRILAKLFSGHTADQARLLNTILRWVPLRKNPVDHWCEAAWLCGREAELYKAFDIQRETLDTYMKGIEQFPLCWELHREVSALLARF